MSRSRRRIRRSHASGNGSSEPHEYGEQAPADIGRPSAKTQVRLADGTEFEIDHGAVTIAAITSCTNTSNPSVMIGAGVGGEEGGGAGFVAEAVGEDHVGAGVEGGQ